MPGRAYAGPAMAGLLLLFVTSAVAQPVQQTLININSTMDDVDSQGQSP
jgi:hypothetical protein